MLNSLSFAHIGLLAIGRRELSVFLRPVYIMSRLRCDSAVYLFFNPLPLYVHDDSLEVHKSSPTTITCCAGV